MALKICSVISCVYVNIYVYTVGVFVAYELFIIYIDSFFGNVAYVHTLIFLGGNVM